MAPGGGPLLSAKRLRTGVDRRESPREALTAALWDVGRARSLPHAGRRGQTWCLPFPCHRPGYGQRGLPLWPPAHRFYELEVPSELAGGLSRKVGATLTRASALTGCPRRSTSRRGAAHRLPGRAHV